MNYSLTFGTRTSGPTTAIQPDRRHGTLCGDATDYGDDYGLRGDLPVLVNLP